MIRLVQIVNRYTKYFLKDIYLNPKHIVYMSESLHEREKLLEGKMNLNIDKSARFTKIKINENSSITEIVVVGEPSYVESKIFNSSERILLKD